MVFLMSDALERAAKRAERVAALKAAGVDQDQPCDPGRTGLMALGRGQLSFEKNHKLQKTESQQVTIIPQVCRFGDLVGCFVVAPN